MRGRTAILLTATGSAAASAADGAPYGDSLVFSAVRNGQPIGTHALAFKREGGQLIVSTSIDLAVKLLGVTAYRYSHRSREIWTGDDLQSITTLTEDDGKQYVRENPTKAVFTALGVGFVLGLIFRR